MRNPGDIFTEPSNIDVHTLKNLGPLTEMAGIWEGSRSLDVPPKLPSAPVRQAFVERTPAVLWASLPHAHCQARRGRDLP
jgi:hypothetical protein